MDVNLIMFKQDGQRKDFSIRQKNTVIGRGEECALRIPLLSVSRRHCELIRGQNELRIRDLASSNGTYLNNRRINEAAIRPGDRLVIGPVVFTVQVDGQPKEITPIKTKAQKATEAQAVAKPAADDEIVELEPDTGGDTAAASSETGPKEELDPIAALEALAAEHKAKQKKDQEKK